MKVFSSSFLFDFKCMNWLMNFSEFSFVVLKKSIMLTIFPSVRPTDYCQLTFEGGENIFRKSEAGVDSQSSAHGGNKTKGT